MKLADLKEAANTTLASKKEFYLMDSNENHYFIFDTEEKKLRTLEHFSSKKKAMDFASKELRISKAIIGVNLGTRWSYIVIKGRQILDYYKKIKDETN